MSKPTLKEILERIVAPEHPWFNPEKAVGEVHQAIAEAMEAVIGANENLLSPKSGEISEFGYERIAQNELKAEQRKRLNQFLGRK